MVTHGGQDGIRNIDLDGGGAAPPGPEDPRRIGPYPLVGLLGGGGMGRVYLGIAEGRYAAVKRVLPVVAQDPDFRRHFNHELDNLARLPAGVSVPLLETGRGENLPWFATEYIPGLTLAEAVRLHEGPLPDAALWYLLRELAARLAALHALDMLHRDVKPSNVMITLDGLALIDFGIARAADQSRLTKTGMVLGTPEYMAPEQAEGKKGLTGAADVFALGSLLFFAATGASPFGQGSGLEVLYRIVHSEPDVSALSDLDPALAAIITDCLDKSPSTRPTAADLLERSAQGPQAGGAVWPASVAELLERRAAFAADVPPLGEFSAETVALRPRLPAAVGQAGGAAGPSPAEAGADADKSASGPAARGNASGALSGFRSSCRSSWRRAGSPASSSCRTRPRTPTGSRPTRLRPWCRPRRPPAGRRRRGGRDARRPRRPRDTRRGRAGRTGRRVRARRRRAAGERTTEAAVRRPVGPTGPVGPAVQTRRPGAGPGVPAVRPPAARPPEGAAEAARSRSAPQARTASRRPPTAAVSNMTPAVAPPAATP
jgi:hypothetical protein